MDKVVVDRQAREANVELVKTHKNCNTKRKRSLKEYVN